jgi:hypothetical protein
VKKVVKKQAKKPAPRKTKPASPKKKTPASSTKSTPATRKKKVADSENEASDDEENDFANAQRVMRMIDRAPKEKLVADLLCRWWYVLPEWPPANFDYASELDKNNLRVVGLDHWEEEPDQDSKGRVKCYAISQYRGLFRDAFQKLHDLRPLEGKPCFTELAKKSEKELSSLLVQAVSKQLEILSSSNERNVEPIIAELNSKLKAYTKKK